MIGKSVVMDVRLVHLVQLPAVCRYRRTVLLRQKCGGENDACEKTETQEVFDKSSDHVPSRLAYLFSTMYPAIALYLTCTN